MKQWQAVGERMTGLFADWNTAELIRTSGEVTTYPLPTEGAGPVGISSGPQGVWFVEIIAGQVGRITPRSQSAMDSRQCPP